MGRILFDNGETWEDRTFELNFYDLFVTKRIVRFFDDNNGYAGLGTNWSMGTEEAKYCLITKDGGITW